MALLLVATLSASAPAARQGAVLVPLDLSGDNTASIRQGALDRAVAEKLSDRFDVHTLTGEPGDGSEGSARKAAAAGAPYRIEGSVVRIGKSVSLELRLLSAEPGAYAKTVVASAKEEEPAGGPAAEGLLPAIYRRLATEAVANLKLRFFGDERGAGRKGRIPAFSGTLTRSASYPGEPVSIALSDVDRDGRREVVAAFPDEIGIYRIEGDELVEKARIPSAGPGIVRIETVDLDRNGMDEIVAVRIAAGSPISDIWTFDGKAYRKTVAALPWYLAVSPSEGEGDVLIGQEGGGGEKPVFRIAFNRYGEGATPDRGAVLPLPAGTTPYDVRALRKAPGGRMLAVVDREGVPSLFEPGGRRAGGGSDPIRSVAGKDAPAGERAVGISASRPPARLFAADLDGDGSDELLAVNNLVTPGVFFESVRVRSGAELLAFVQDGGELRLAWRTGQLGFGVQDAFLEEEKGKGIRLGMLVRDKGKLLERQSEWRIVWMR
jgi:hypothetical protein